MTHQTDLGNEGTATTVTVVGTGAIGGAVSRRLLEAKQAVVVWNRTAGRIQELTDLGATTAPSLQAAVTASGLTLMTLKDYQAVQDVLGQLDGDLSGRTIAVLCTGSPGDAELARDRVEQLGAHYLDAGVQTSPEDMGTDRATILYSGSGISFKRHQQVLRLLSVPHFVGTSPPAAAVWDLALFGLWYDAQFGLLRALDTVKAAGIDIDAFAQTAAIQLEHVIKATATTASELRQGEFPRGPADLHEHLVVVRQLIEMRVRSQFGDGGLSHLSDLIESMVADGRGDQGLNATAANSAG